MTEQTESEFPPISVTDVVVRTSAQYHGEVELTPYFSRSPHSFWNLFFEEEWGALDGAPWLTAGFTRTTTDEAKRVEGLLYVACDRANKRMNEHLPRWREQQPSQFEQFMKLEGSAAASEPGAYPWRSPGL